MMGLSAFLALSLAEARSLRAEYLSLLVRGIDLQTQAKQAAQQQQIAIDSIFANVAAKWFAIKRNSVTPDYAKDIWRWLEKDIFPTICKIPVQEMKARTLVEALEPITARGALETVRRLVQRINEIMIYVVSTGLIDANPASGIGMAFEKPKYFDAYSTHIPAVILAVNNNPMRFSNPLTARALLQAQQNSDETLSIKRDADPVLISAGTSKHLNSRTACIWVTPISCRENPKLSLPYLPHLHGGKRLQECAKSENLRAGLQMKLKEYGVNYEKRHTRQEPQTDITLTDESSCG